MELTMVPTFCTDIVLQKKNTTHLEFRLDVAKALLEASHPYLSYVSNLLLKLQTFPSDSLAVASQNSLVAVLTAKSTVTEQQGKGNRLSGCVRPVKWLGVYTHALNATIPSSITNRF